MLMWVKGACKIMFQGIPPGTPAYLRCHGHQVSCCIQYISFAESLECHGLSVTAQVISDSQFADLFCKSSGRTDTQAGP